MSIAEVHKNYSQDWWTPKPWLGWVQATLGGGYYDPCPTNYDASLGSLSGLSCSWGMKFYCNHPGARGSTKAWWAKFAAELEGGGQGIWCAFSVEQLRHMDPSPFTLPGYLIMPAKRVGFVWGGPTEGKRIHGEQCKSPANWTVFWSSVFPAEPPEDCIIVKTGDPA